MSFILLILLSFSANADQSKTIRQEMIPDQVVSILGRPSKVDAWPYKEKIRGKTIGRRTGVRWTYENSRVCCSNYPPTCIVAFDADKKLFWQEDVCTQFIDLNSGWDEVR